MLLSYIKAFHVIAIIAWMAGLLYLPRLFVYHAGSAEGLGAVRDLQGDGEAAAPLHHHAGHDRELDPGALPRLLG